MNPTLLVIEDEPAIQELLAINLKHAGFLAVRAGSAEEGESTIRTALPDLILLDMALPDCTGLELAGVIRQQRYLDNIPILFVTSEKQRPRHLDANDIGVDGFLVKPVPADVLAMTVMARARRHRRLAGHITTDSLTGEVIITNMADGSPTTFDVTLRDLTGSVQVVVPPNGNYAVNYSGFVSVTPVVGAPAMTLSVNNLFDQQQTVRTRRHL